jgi:cation diffusion facilitator CzcD-associated flavoprotein CzcO
MTLTNSRVCIIGAGAAGITTAKALHERGIPFTCFEASDEVGGNWLFGNSNGTSSAYRNLFINSSRRRMEYADFPLPESLPDYPHHSDLARYFRDYVDHFGFRSRIVFQTRVKHAEPTVEDRWRITLDSGEVQYFDALLVANGHHWDPRWPEPPFPGADRFTGLQLHSHQYVDATIFENKNVVILGVGNSAMDIAVESSYAARHTYLAHRRGAWIVPKYLFGRPIDEIFFQNPYFSRVPLGVRRRLAHWLIRIVVGSPERYGLMRPDHRLGEAHPTVSSRILDRLAHGMIVAKPNIAELGERSVRFEDGSVVDADVVVYATGYKITFPFFDEGFLSAPDNLIQLFLRVFHADVPNLAFIGLVQPTSAIMPIAEAQGRWVGEWLLGHYLLPSAPAMRQDMERFASAMGRRYVPSKRHTIQVDFDDYLIDLAKEVRAGVRRAASSRPTSPAAIAGPSAPDSGLRRPRAAAPR